MRKICFFGLLHFKKKENRRLNFNSINDDQKAIVYLKNAILLDKQLKFHGYNFILITNKNEFDTFSESFKRILNSFKKVSTNKQLSDLSPPKIRILRNSQNNNFLPSIREKISLQTKYSIEIFKIINDYENKPEEKRKIKSIYWLSSSSSLTFAAFLSKFCTAAYSLLNLLSAVKYICRSE